MYQVLIYKLTHTHSPLFSLLKGLNVKKIIVMKIIHRERFEKVIVLNFKKFLILKFQIPVKT
ncbi:MAG: hypothetical protein EAX86_11650 [Candidatus Heimdallarchaeota archaeon]|nr:hypothetical protein [Candidatus Heimdallarchaeota archaeon]